MLLVHAVSEKVKKREIFTFWPINLQISGGREVAPAAPAFDTSGLTLTASCVLQDLSENSSLPCCPDGRTHFAGGLGRGCSNPLGWPSSPPETSKPAITECEAGATEFPNGSSMIVAVRFRFRILADKGEVVGEKMASSETRRRVV